MPSAFPFGLCLQKVFLHFLTPLLSIGAQEPSLTFALSGKLTIDDGNNPPAKMDLKFGNGDDDDMKGLDLGANVITGYRFPGGLFLSANYNEGLNNLIPGGSPDGTSKSHYFGIKLGWLLNSKGKKQ